MTYNWVPFDVIWYKLMWILRG